MNDETIVGKGITLMDGRCGGRPCIKGTRLAVWFMVCAMGRCKGMNSDEVMLDNYPHITQEDLDNVVEYWNDNTEEIQKQIDADL